MFMSVVATDPMSQLGLSSFVSRICRPSSVWLSACLNLFLQVSECVAARSVPILTSTRLVQFLVD